MCSKNLSRLILSFEIGDTKLQLKSALACLTEVTTNSFTVDKTETVPSATPHRLQLPQLRPRMLLT
jgi:hypothetical protein